MDIRAGMFYLVCKHINSVLGSVLTASYVTCSREHEMSFVNVRPMKILYENTTIQQKTPPQKHITQSSSCCWAAGKKKKTALVPFSAKQEMEKKKKRPNRHVLFLVTNGCKWNTFSRELFNKSNLWCQSRQVVFALSQTHHHFPLSLPHQSGGWGMGGVLITGLHCSSDLKTELVSVVKFKLILCHPFEWRR